MTFDMSQFYQVFFEEAAEHLGNMESLLLALDVESPSLEDLNAIFRAAHSIKGGAGTFGFNDMASLTHVLETLLDKLRKEELGLRPEMIDAFLAAGDVLKDQLAAHQGGEAVEQARIDEVSASLDRLAAGTAAPAATAASIPPSPASGGRQEREAVLRELAYPATGAALPEGVLDYLRGLGELHVVVNGPEGFRATLSGDAVEADIREAFAFHGDPAQLQITADGTGEDEAFGLFGDEPVAPPADDSFGLFADEPAAPSAPDESFGLFTDEPAQAPAAESQEAYGFFDAPGAPAFGAAPETGYGLFAEEDAKALPAPTIKVEAAPAPAGRREIDDPKLSEARAGRRTTDKVVSAPQADASIRVNVEKVDQLINLVGELVITQAMLAQSASNLSGPLFEKLQERLTQLERNTRDLQEAVMGIRMMPMSTVFSRFPRVVRDVAGKLGKQVELKTRGEGTEIDKGLIEKLTDPLTHLVRNSLDHGLEKPEDRVKAGKNPKGSIILAAFHQGGNVVIEVSDDGRGLNREKILAKAREKGLAVSDAMSDQEVWMLIFAPGFSTADQVTDVSGRGVGMDVVKRNIEGLGGRVELNSAPGFGATVTIRLPLTLAILDGMSVAVGDENYIIPLTLIVESLKPQSNDIRTVTGEGRVIQVRGEYLPIIGVHEVFGARPRSRAPEEGILVVVETDHGRAALWVDELLGQQQVVIKSLESNYRKVAGVSGATIMGDGSVALILDVSAVVREGRGTSLKAAA